MKLKFIRAITAAMVAVMMLLASGCEFNTYVVTDKKPEQSIDRFFYCLQSCDFDGCDKYLANNVSFNISNDTGYEFADVMLQKQMSGLNYSIIGESEINGGSASCSVQVRSVDSADIEALLIDEYAEARREYMKENDLKEFPIDDKNVISEIAASSLDVIWENIQPTTKDVTIDLTFADGRWKIILSDELCEAILGGSIE